MPKLISRLRDKLFPKYRVKSWGKIFSNFNLEPFPSRKRGIRAALAEKCMETARPIQREPDETRAKTLFETAGNHFFKVGNFQKAAEAYSKAAEASLNSIHCRTDGYAPSRDAEVLIAFERAKLRAKAGEAYKKDGDRVKAAQQYELGAKALEELGLLRPALEMYKHVYNTFYNIGNQKDLARTKRKIAELEERIDYLKNLPWNAPLEQWLRKPK